MTDAQTIKVWRLNMQTTTNSACLKPRRDDRSTIKSLSSSTHHLNPTRISWNGWLTRISGKACLLLASRGWLLSPTRMSWKGWPTWMSREASHFGEQRTAGSVSPSQPNQDILEGLTNLDVQEGQGLFVLASRARIRRSLNCT